MRLIYLSIIGFGVLAIVIMTLYIDANQTCSIKMKWGIVYGNHVYLNGNPSARLKARLDAAFELYQMDKIQKIFVSGGTGKNGYNEAKAMFHYLIKKGVLSKNIVKDPLGFTSSKTSQNAFQLLGGDENVVAISQQFHISRTKLSLHNAGFKNICGYYPRYFEWRDIYSTLREVPAWIKYWLMGL